MNKFKEVAALFGLELGEEFNVRFENGVLVPYCLLKFNDDGLIDCNGVTTVALLIGLIKGDVTVEKLPWKPKLGEMYWYVFNKKEVSTTRNSNEIFDSMCFKLGNYFKTKEEAEQNKDRISSMLKG